MRFVALVSHRGFSAFFKRQQKPLILLKLEEQSLIWLILKGKMVVFVIFNSENVYNYIKI